MARKRDRKALQETGGRHRNRICALDTLRGFTIVSMVAFHAAYDLAYLYGADMPWFTAGPFQDVWRASISWTFLLLAGWMTSLSRSNLRRAGIYAAAAVAVWAATSIAAVDTPVSFGILFCMASSTLLWAGFEHGAGRDLERLSRPALAAAALGCVVLFFMTRSVPTVLYPMDGLAWLGFPSPAFASGDYYPLIPYAMLYFAGGFAAALWKRSHAAYPSWMRRDWCPPLSVVGRHSLSIYLLHQPLVLAVIAAVHGL